MALPTILFIILLIFNREELGFKGISICFLISATVIGVMALAGLHEYFFIAFQSLFDIILILILFGGDITIR